MANWSHIQSWQNGAATTAAPTSGNSGSSTTAGNILIAWVCWDGATGTVTSVTDTQDGTGATWHQVKLQQGNGESIAMWVSYGRSSGGTTNITANLSASQNNAIVLGEEYSHTSGAINSNPVRAGATGATGTGGQTPDPGALTATANDLCLGGCNVSGAQPSAGTGFTRSVSNFDQNAEFQLNVAAGSIDPNWSNLFPSWVAIGALLFFPSAAAPIAYDPTAQGAPDRRGAQRVFREQALSPTPATASLAGVAIAVATATATLTGQGALSGTAAATTSATGTATSAGALSGTAAATATASATLTGAGALSGTAAAAATASGTLAQLTIVGPAFDPTLYSAPNRGGPPINFRALDLSTILGSLKLISGTAAATATASGTLGGSGALSGTAAATGTSTATLTGAGALVGSASATTTASATATASVAGSGTAAAVGTASGTLTGAGALSGSSSATGTAAGTLGGAGALQGTAAAIATATGTVVGLVAVIVAHDPFPPHAPNRGSPTWSFRPLELSSFVPPAGAASGAASAISGASGTLAGAGALAGSAAATTTASAAPAGTGPLVGAAGGFGTAAGSLTGAGALVGSAGSSGGGSGGLGGGGGGGSGAQGGATGTLTAVGGLAGTASAFATASLSSGVSAGPPFQLFPFDGPGTSMWGPPNRYLPGQGVRCSCPCYQGGQLQDPDAGVACVVTWPDGTTTTGTVLRDGQGIYHADVQVPPSMTPGPAFARWAALSSNPNEGGRGKRELTVTFA